MDERRLQQSLAAVAEQHAPGGHDSDADVARGRAALRRRRVAAIGGGALATALVLGGGVAVGQLAAAPAGRAPVGPAASATAVDPSPATSPTPSPTEQPKEKERKKRLTARERAVLEQAQLMAETAAFRNGLYDITAEYLDPAKKYLNYSTQSLQMSSSPDGSHTVGIKMGWKVPGEEGEGLVQVAVSDIPPKPHEGIECGLYIGGVTCEPLVLPSGVSLEVGENASGAYDVVYRRSDGVSVEVIVDPLFGNSSLVPVKGMTISRQDVYRLVQDERFEAPDL